MGVSPDEFRPTDQRTFSTPLTIGVIADTHIYPHGRRQLPDEVLDLFRRFRVGLTLYSASEGGRDAPPRTLVIIEEAHEFLASERIDRMPHLFAQVSRIAKRGRKRWLGLVFVTQLPQHLPNQVIGLVNNWIVHKISDASVVSTLKRSVSGIDESLWNRLPSLAPGQAIVSFTHMHRPVLTSIDPTPAKLRLVD